MSKFVSIPGEDKFLPFSKTKRRDGPSQKLMLKQYWRGGGARMFGQKVGSLHC